MSKVLQVQITCSNGYFDEQHKYFIPIFRVVDWCDDKYGVRKFNKDIEVVSVSLLDANRNPIEIASPSDASEGIVDTSEVSEVAESDRAFLAAMRDIGSYDDDLTLSEVDLFNTGEIEYPVGCVDPDDHWD